MKRISHGGTLSAQVPAVFGADGMSAYEIAVREGFDGTVEEWLESLNANNTFEPSEEDMADIVQSVIDELPVYEDDQQRIVVNQNGTTKLDTSGKWCDRDIEIVTNVRDDSIVPVLQDISATPTKSKQTFTADSGYDGIGTFTVDAIPDDYIKPSGSLEITENGTFDVTNYASAVVNVAPSVGAITVHQGRFVVASAMSITSQDVFTGAVSDNFYFYAECESRNLSSSPSDCLSVFEFERQMDGSCHVEGCSISGQATEYDGGSTVRKSSSILGLTLTAPGVNTLNYLRQGTWYWTLVMAEV